MKHQAIYNIHADVLSIVDDIPLNKEGVEVTLNQSAVDAEVVTLQSASDSKRYARDRAEAYPSLTDQADMQYWDSVNGTTTWADAITAVKEAHPKP
jgi:hypothetical protein